jgi:hypothetical protein
MKLASGQVPLSATDRAILACRHVTFLDLQVLSRKREAPQLAAPDLLVVQEIGRRHEAAYLKQLPGVEA